MSVRVSVVVSTYQRATRVAELVEALERQTLPIEQFEVVIVDNGSTDSTAGVLADLQQQSPLQLTVLRVEQNRGPARARNLGWSTATSEVIAFTDDDCVPDPRWLEELLVALEQNDVQLVQGRTLPRPDQLDRVGPWSRTQQVDSEDGYYQTCNIAYLRRALEEVGGFRTDFPVAAGEDTDLAWRVKKAGFASCFAGDALVFHEVLPSSFMRHLKERPRWGPLVQVIRNHPDLRRLAYKRYFYRAGHVRVILVGAVMFVAAVVSPRLPLALAAAASGGYLLRTRQSTTPAHERLLLLAQVFTVDAVELAVFTAASVRYRTLLL